MRRNDLAQLGAGGAVPLPGAFRGAAEHVAGDDGQDDGVPAYADAYVTCWPLTRLFTLWTVSLPWG
jgi:hypothetical protein